MRTVPRLLSLGVAVLLAGCSVNPIAQDPAANPTVVQITAADLPLSESPALASEERVVALANGSAEIVYALGLGAALVGRDIASTFPGAEKVPIVTSAHSVSAEKVLAQRPTLVLIDARTGPPEALGQLRSAGVRIIEVPEAWTLTDMSARIRAIGLALDAAEPAEAVITQTESVLAEIRASGADTRVAFLYLRGAASIYLLGGEGSGADALLAAVGAVDVGSASGRAAFTPLTSEALIAAKPDILLVMRKGLESVGGVEGLVKLPGVAQTPAGIAKRVIVVDDEVLLAFGPRTGALLAKLSGAIQALQP